MPSFREIVDDVHNNAILTAITGLTYSVGRKEAKLNLSYPRVVWIPMSGTIGTTQNVGKRLDGQGNRRRQVRTNQQLAQVQFWGEDLDAAEDLMYAVVSASWQQLVGSVQFGNHEWFSEQPNTADYAQHGYKITMDAVVMIPIHDRTDALTVVASQDSTLQFV